MRAFLLLRVEIGLLSLVAAVTAFGQNPPATPDESQVVVPPNRGQGVVPLESIGGPTATEVGSREAAAPTTQAAPKEYSGEITGSNVYVRSGPGTNYYPITKLQEGERVRVVGEEYGWLRIVPPEGCFSVIDRRYVDRGPDDLGVVNADRVRVYAGSLLVDRSYAVQLQLSRGAEVAVVGEDEESGFYRIAPPEGATAWVSGQYVKPATSPKPALERVAPTSSAPGIGTPSDDVRAENPNGGEPEAPASMAQIPASVRALLDTLPEGPLREELTRIEAGISDEKAKSPARQNLRPLIQALRELAAKTQDESTQSYVLQRAERLGNWVDLVERVLILREQGDALPPRTAWTPPRRDQEEKHFDVEGELRKSQVFASQALPTYYRVVDPSKHPARTLAYLRLPKGDTTSLDRYLGQYIRVRAAKREYLGTVGRTVPVIVPAEIGVPATQATDRSPGAEPPVAETKTGDDTGTQIAPSGDGPTTAGQEP